MEELINLIVSNGMSVVIIAYFLYKDYRFNAQILDVLGEVKEVLGTLKYFSGGSNNGNNLQG